MGLIETGATAAVAFAGTNVDDIVVLSVLFARRDADFRARHIIFGQALGFALLVAASLVVSAGLLALPGEAVGVLGLIPIGLGLRGLRRARRTGRSDEEAFAVRPAMGVTAVASITVANGADNVAIYAPLFATVGSGALATTVAVFFAMLGLWCLVSLLIGSRPGVVRGVNWAGHYAIPVVLIALGLFIVVESGIVGAVT